MAVNREETLHVATLARLRLSDEQITTFGKQLSDILDYVAQLDELDTTGVEATTHLNFTPVAATLREDVAQARLTRDDVLANAPDSADGHFRVPKVVGDRG